MRRLLALLVLLVAGLGAAAVWLSRAAPAAPSATISVADALGGPAAEGFARALAPRPFAFPDDHGPHPGFRTEWWYVTGNLETEEGRHAGYQVTFFRNALAAGAAPRESAWAATDVWMAHLAVTDTAGGRFHAFHRLVRGALGLAGATARPLRVWTEDWSLEGIGEPGPGGTGPLRVRAAEGDIALDLVLEPGKPVVLQGERGLSRKGPEPGNASYYYSLTRMPTRGTIRIGGAELRVRGLSWMDREWSTSALGDKVGWDWFALQLDDGRDLMFYQLRRADGTTDAFSAGSLVDRDGASRPLAAGDVRLEVLGGWTSPRGGVRYPARWRLAVPAEDLVLEIAPRLADQEHLEPVRYWEGAVAVRGRAGGRAVSGAGYVELVGYAEPPARSAAR